MIMRMKSEGEWNCHSYIFVTFVVLTVDQIDGCDDGLPYPQTQDCHVFRRTGTSSLFCSKNRSHHYIDVEVSKKLRIRNEVLDM